jgi:hypothetical protein
MTIGDDLRAGVAQASREETAANVTAGIQGMGAMKIRAAARRSQQVFGPCQCAVACRWPQQHRRWGVCHPEWRGRCEGNCGATREPTRPVATKGALALGSTGAVPLFARGCFSSLVQRIAPCGTRHGLMVRRSALQADCTVLLGPVERGTTRYALTRCARTNAASQMGRRALRVAAQIAPARCRPTRSRCRGCLGPNTTSAAAKTVRGRPRCACGAPRSAATLAARAARFNH